MEQQRTCLRIGLGPAWAQVVPPDTTPDPFRFTPETGATAGATVTSDEVTISGINAAANFRFLFCRLVSSNGLRSTVNTCTLVKNGAEGWREPACKPGSVGGSHSSATHVAVRL